MKLPRADKAEAFAYYWRVYGIAHDPQREYHFHPKRKWRFDFAWPASYVAVEVDGNAWNVPGGGRHMQDSDLLKLSAAAALGWRVLRFSPGMLRRNPAQCVSLVLQALSGGAWAANAR